MKAFFAVVILMVLYLIMENKKSFWEFFNPKFTEFIENKSVLAVLWGLIWRYLAISLLIYLAIYLLL
jgi:glutathionylspermidine synthase